MFAAMENFEFFKLMSVILFANILTVAFVYGMYMWTWHEKNGSVKSARATGHIASILLVFGFLVAGLTAWGFNS